jgi:hypothetical protein
MDGASGVMPAPHLRGPFATLDMYMLSDFNVGERKAARADIEIAVLG